MRIKFPHIAPEGYHYETEKFKTNVIRVVLCCDRTFCYNEGKSVRTVWGFVDTKSGQFFRPINYKKPGKVISGDVKDETTAYTSMKKPKLSIIEQCMV